MCPALCWILGNIKVHNGAPLKGIYSTSGNWEHSRIIRDQDKHYHAVFHTITYFPVCLIGIQKTEGSERAGTFLGNPWLLIKKWTRCGGIGSIFPWRGFSETVICFPGNTLCSSTLTPSQNRVQVTFIYRMQAPALIFSHMNVSCNFPFLIVS